MYLADRLFVEVAPGTLGLVHVSELELEKFGVVEDFHPGDRIDVKVLEACPPLSTKSGSQQIEGRLSVALQVPWQVQRPLVLCFCRPDDCARMSADVARILAACSQSKWPGEVDAAV